MQLSDTGLTPGSGVGNHRRAVDRAALGVPVIAVGVPTVIDGATLCADLLAEAGCPDRYDNTSRHDHLICVRCGALSDRTLSDLTASIEEQIGCGILSYDLRVRWLCPACRAVERGSACSVPPHLS